MSHQRSQTTFTRTPVCNRLMPKCPPPPRRSALISRYDHLGRQDSSPSFPLFPIEIDDNIDFPGLFLCAPEEGGEVFSRGIAGVGGVAGNSQPTAPKRIQLKPRVSLHQSRFAFQAPSLLPMPTSGTLHPRPIRYGQNIRRENRCLSVEREMDSVEEDQAHDTEDLIEKAEDSNSKNICVTP